MPEHYFQKMNNQNPYADLVLDKIEFANTKDIFRYAAVLVGLEPDFDYEHYPYFLAYCGVIPNDSPDIGKFWNVWLATINRGIDTIGVCGLYSCGGEKDVAWIGYFGTVPEFRKQGVGLAMLEFMQDKARAAGFSRIAAYCDREPLDWYLKQGFEIWGMSGVEKILYAGCLGGETVVVKQIS